VPTKEIIVLRASYSSAEVCVKCDHLKFCRVEGGVKFLKHFKGAQAMKIRELCTRIWETKMEHVVLGGLMVSVLSMELNVRGIKPS
jgi:hypothetical protein